MKPTNEQATFYLKFVDAAYDMYDADPTNLTPPKKNFPDKNYEIITYLTSIDPASGLRVFFGFIAGDPTNKDGKPGILAIRGTDNFYEWWTDFDAVPIPFAPFPGSRVARGFDEFVTGIEWMAAPDGTAEAGAELAATWPKGFVVTGHSLGGAIGTLLAATWLAAVPQLLLTLVTAASPAVGNGVFATAFAGYAKNSWRYINDGDVIASSLDWLYTQVATGIGLFSADIEPTPICEHSLITYLYLLSPAGTPCTSDCCFFEDAPKRQLAALREEKRLAAATG